LVNPPLKPRDAARHSAEDKQFFLFEHLLNVGYIRQNIGIFNVSIPVVYSALIAKVTPYAYPLDRE
jgi:hypothetical protein